MAEANQTVLKVLNHLNSKIGTGGVVESFVSDDGSQWFRKFSDGWIEQGGVYTGNETNKTFNLLKSFSNTNYSLCFSLVTNEGRSQYTRLISVNSKNTSSFVASCEYAIGASWFACGY